MPVDRVNVKLEVSTLEALKAYLKYRIHQITQMQFEMILQVQGYKPKHAQDGSIDTEYEQWLVHMLLTQFT